MVYSNKQNWISREFEKAYWFQEGPGVRNWQFRRSGIKLLNVANISKYGFLELNKTERYLSSKEIESKYKHFLVDEGDLVIASSGISFDEDGFLRTRGAFVHKQHLPLCMNTSTIRFKSKEGISDLHFLKFWLDSYEFRDQITRLVTGSAQQNFGPSHLKSLNITLPPLPEQKRIAAILEKVDRLRRMRRYALELSGTYLQSVFLEMFGDPVINPMEWDKKELQELITPSRPITYGILKPGPNIPNGVPYIRVIDIQDNIIVLPGIRKTSPKIAEEYKRSKLQGGDLLLSIRGHVGRMAVVPDSLFGANITQDTARLATYEPTDAWFLLGYLSTTVMRTHMANFTRGAAVQGINLGDVKEIPVIVPPIGERQKYSCVARKIERLRLQQAEAGRQAEHLFQTLLHKAFQGELSLGEEEVLMPDAEATTQQMPVLADVVEPISRDAYQMALPME